MTKVTLIKGNISLGLAYRFRGSVHYHPGSNMAVSMKAWLWRSREFFYILI